MYRQDPLIHFHCGARHIENRDNEIKATTQRERKLFNRRKAAKQNVLHCTK